MGEAAVCGSASARCSPPQKLSKPAASAARATAAIASGVTHGRMFIPKSPYFIFLTRGPNQCRRTGISLMPATKFERIRRIGPAGSALG